MCGIVGYVGGRDAQPILLSGLKRLEYRGYDSAGLAVADESGRIDVRKRAGRIERLQEALAERPLRGPCGIGHTRWATHGGPADENAHPQTDERGGIAVVHNGIIENHQALRDELTARGVPFRSQTDTEAVAHLLRLHDHGDMARALREVTARLRGHYALAVMTDAQPGMIFCVRRGSPLVIGRGRGENALASDLPALLPLTREVCCPEEGHIAVLTRDAVLLLGPDGQPREAVFERAEWTPEEAEKGGHAHFMRKEIFEQPAALARTLALYRDGPVFPVPPAIDMVACGTARHAALIGAHYFKRLANLPTRVFAASEYRCDPPLPVPGALTLGISQSGETADTLFALEMAKRRGLTAVLTNTPGSTLTRVADTALFTRAGAEIGVASTKAFTAQLLALLLLSMGAGRQSGFLSAYEFRQLNEALHELPEKAEVVLRRLEALGDFAAQKTAAPVCFFIGRGMDLPLALEGALKLKEVACQPCEAYPAGELKHGPLALVRAGVPVVAVCSQGGTLEKTLMNLKEVKARGAETLCLCPERLAKRARMDEDAVFPVPDAPLPLLPLLLSLPLQWIAYQAAVARGLDPDKPRNLAKSVTVE